MSFLIYITIFILGGAFGFFVAWFIKNNELKIEKRVSEERKKKWKRWTFVLNQ